MRLQSWDAQSRRRIASALLGKPSRYRLGTAAHSCWIPPSPVAFTLPFASDFYPTIIVLFPIIFFILLGCFSSWLVIHGLLAAGVGQGGAADPQHHHTHSGVIPRIGGVGIATGFGLTYLLCFFQLNPADNQTLMHFAVVGGAVAAFALGLIDDFRPLGAKLKLGAQILIAAAAYKCGLSIAQL